jgi:hypothetical protein
LEAPEIVSIEYRADNDGRTLELAVDEDTLNDMEHGVYTDWDCLNATYRVENIRYSFSNLIDTHHVMLTLGGVFRLAEIAAEYEKLPRVQNAGSVGLIGDGPTICLTAAETTWYWVFDRASGDCVEGCTAHTYYYFTTEPEGTMTRQGQWFSESGEARPAWFDEYASREACR